LRRILDVIADARRTPDPWVPPMLAGGGVLRWTAANLATCGLYFALGWVVSRFFAAYGLFPAPIWLPTGIAVVAAMVGQARLFPGIFLGSFLTNDVLFAAPLHVTALISFSNALGPVVGAIVMRHLRPQRGLFTSLYGVVSFVFCTTFLSPAIIAGGGALALMIGQPFDPTRFYSIWVNWWLSDSGGSLYLAPSLVLWLGLEREPEGYASDVRDGWLRHHLAVWLWIAAVSIALFLTPPLQGTYIRAAFPFLLVVPVSWIALRMSLRSAYTLVTLVAIIATAGTVAGYGPFQAPSLANPLQLVGTLVVLLAMNVLTIVALVSERHEAETANRAKSMFLATTTHELRTPLNAIIGFSELIRNPPAGSLPEQQHDAYMRLIQSSSQHLLSLINDLMAMSRMEAGRPDLLDEPVALAPVAAVACDLIAVEARAKQVAVETDIADVTVRADVKAMRQILLNLLSNAVKFTPAGGRVRLATGREPDGSLIIRVSDTGVGIPRDALERVFEPFARVHRDRADGTGLGLSITRGLVALHGGTITLDSDVGKGTVATIRLPAERVVRPPLPTHGPTAAA